MCQHEEMPGPAIVNGKQCNACVLTTCGELDYARCTHGKGCVRLTSDVQKAEAPIVTIAHIFAMHIHIRRNRS